MKGAQQCRDVQADFVCKLEKEQVDAFEVYPNTVRLNLLNGCPSRPPLRLCCIFFVFIYDYRRFSHISVHSKRKKNFPTTPSYSVCFLWVHEASSDTWILRTSTRPSPAAYTEGVTRGRKGKGVGRGGGGWGDKRRDHLPFPFHLFSPNVSPSPPPSQFATATKAINHCPSIHGEVSYAWSRSINVFVHVDQKMANSSLTRTRLSTSSATMSWFWSSELRNNEHEV